METHASYDHDDDTSKDTESSIGTENSFEEEIDRSLGYIDQRRSVQGSGTVYDEILQALLIEGHDESEAKEEALATCFPKEFGRCLYR